MYLTNRKITHKGEQITLSDELITKTAQLLKMDKSDLEKEVERLFKQTNVNATPQAKSSNGLQNKLKALAEMKGK